MSERHRVLVIGTGSIGERHVRCFQATGRAEVAIVETNERLRHEIARRYSVASFVSLEQALAHPFAAAVVATPAPCHVPLARQLVNAGIPALIEKPLSTSLDGVAELARVARERRVVAAVAYVYRSHPALTAMRDAIAAGEFGPPNELVAVCGQHFPTYRPAYRSIYYASRATGGGAIQDALTHVINAGEWLVGPVDRLVADAARQSLDGVDVEDTVHLVARHGRVLASYALNQHQAPNETTITVVCERGTARIEVHNHRWLKMTEPGGAWHEEPFGPLERDSLFISQAGSFLDCVEGTAAPLCPLDEGIQTLRANLAALTSAETGQWQTVTPTRETPS